MDRKRWFELQRDYDGKLTPQEMEQGWHFCYDWDFLLVGPGMQEQFSCTCQPWTACQIDEAKQLEALAEAEKSKDLGISDLDNNF